ncbi:MAG: DUF1501 domain-containing protein [Planctomycetota bacterium]
MFSVSNRNHPPSSHLSRRELLRVGALGLSGLTLADLLRHEATAADSAQPAATNGKRSKSVIYIVLNGGPSHIDMWDLKPQAPAEHRGPFSPIATKLPGVQICEHMPRQAAMLDRAALVRGIRSVENDHYLSEVYTGLPRSAGKRPAFGSIISRLAPTQFALPTYVSMNETSDLFDYEKPHYAGAGHAPFRPFHESLRDLTPVKNLEQLENRKALLAAFDNLHRELDRRDVSSFGGVDRFQTQALEMIASPKVREAFDLTNESPETLARYGHKAGKYPHQTAKQYMYDWNGKPFLMARRLVEAGVRVVTLHAGDWDHHSSADGDIFFALKCLMPLIDMSITALVTDLHERGLSDDVLVVVLGEFGRTPKISPLGPGREHWADAGCALFFGGGLTMGQVIGETDSRAERSINGQISFQNIMSTIYHVLGIDLDVKLPDFNGRPQHLVDDRQPLRELLV